MDVYLLLLSHILLYNVANYAFFVFISVGMMNVLIQIQLKSTFPRMTHLLTLFWTPVRVDKSQKCTPATPIQMFPETVERPLPALPGSPPPTTPRNKSINMSHPSPSHRRQRHLMSQCWLNRDSPSLLCHVTFINTNQRGEKMATPSSSQQTRSPRTVDLFSSPKLPVVLSWVKLTLRCGNHGWRNSCGTKQWTLMRMCTSATELQSLYKAVASLWTVSQPGQCPSGQIIDVSVMFSQTKTHLLNCLDHV